MKHYHFAKILAATAIFSVLICFLGSVLPISTVSESSANGSLVHLIPDDAPVLDVSIRKPAAGDSVVDATSGLADSVKKWLETMEEEGALLSDNPTAAAAERNAAANEIFSLPELPDGVVADLARMFEAPDEDEVWRDYCLQFLGSALERTDGVTDEDRALARETLVEALAYTNATFAGTALRALHRGDPDDPLVALNALRIARDSTYPSASRITALLVLEECTSLGADGGAITPEERRSILLETADIISRDSSATSLLRQTAEAVLQRVDPSRGLQ